MAPQVGLEPTSCCNIGSVCVSSHLPITVLLLLLFPRFFCHRQRSETSPRVRKRLAGSLVRTQFLEGKTKRTSFDVRGSNPRFGTLVVLLSLVRITPVPAPKLSPFIRHRRRSVALSRGNSLLRKALTAVSRWFVQNFRRQNKKDIV